MSIIKIDRVRESAPVILNLVKDSGWVCTYGVVSVVAIIPVLTFQAYEIWKCRKEGWHKIMFHTMSLIALSGNTLWMVSDLFYHDHLRPYAKWIFAASFIFLGLYVIFTLRQKKIEAKPRRVMMVSKQTRNIVFVHTKMSHLRRKPAVDHHIMMVQQKLK